MALPIGILFTAPQDQAYNLVGVGQANATYKFYYTGTTTLAPIYKDGALSTQWTQPVTADAMGRDLTFLSWMLGALASI